jgi:subtilisin family serine protease
MRIILTSFLIFSFFLVPIAGASFLPNDPYYSNQWYLSRIKAPAAWEKINRSPSITIAVIDSGIDINHPDLKDNIWTNQKEIASNGMDDDHNGFIDDVNGWDFVLNVPDPSPKFEEGWTESGLAHGTIIAGIIAAVGDNNKGITGVSWQAKIMPLRALNGKGEGRISAVVRAIDYATNNGADIINLSFVGFNYNQALHDALQRAYEAGVIVVAAAGNEQEGGEGYNIDEDPIYPACYHGKNGENIVLGVAASDALDQKTDFSSYGFKCVDITAPGISFFSTIPAGSNAVEPNKLYDGFWSGTSMAAPIISGSLALIAEINPQLQPTQVVNILLQSADNISLLNPNYLGQLGSGRVNLERAVMMAQERLYSRLGRLLINPASGFNQEIGSDTKELVNTISLSVTDKSGSVITDFPFPEAEAGVFAAGDVDGKGDDEIISGAPIGHEPYVSIYGSDGELRGRFLVYDRNFKGGFSLAVADVTGDGLAEIIVGAGPGGGPHVRIFDHKGRLKGQFFAFEESFRGGANVGAGNIDSSAAAEIVVGRGAGALPEVRIFDRRGNLQGVFLAYEESFRGGVKLAVANVDGRLDRGTEEIITVPGPGREALVKVFSNKAVLKHSFLAFRSNWQGGVNVAAGDLNNNGRADIAVSAQAGATPHVRVFSGSGQLQESFYFYPESFSGGVNISIAHFIN